MKLSRVHGLSGEVTVPGDKSVSHRSIMLGSIAKGNTEVEGFLQGADCLSSIACFRKMGVEIENNGDKVLVHGRGLRGLKAPDSILDVGNSGTTTRDVGNPCGTAICINGQWRCVDSETSDEADYHAAFPDGCRYSELTRE